MNMLWIPTTEWTDMSSIEQANSSGILDEETIVFHCYVCTLASELSVKVDSKKYCYTLFVVGNYIFYLF